MAIHIEEGSRLDRSSPLGDIHTGRRILKNGKAVMDQAFKKQYRFWITKHNPALKFGEIPEPFTEVMDLAVNQFAGGDERQLNELPIILRHSTAERNFRVGKKRFAAWKMVDCYSDNPKDCGNQERWHRVDLQKITHYKTPVVPVEALEANAPWMHYGDVAHRTMADGTTINVPCPQDPRLCPYASHIDKKTQEPIYDCKMRGILHCSFELWYHQSFNHEFQLWTSSWKSIRNMATFLNNAEQMLRLERTQTGADLSMITLRLYVRKGSVRTPDKKQAPQPELSLKYDEQFQQLFRQITAGMGAKTLELLQSSMEGSPRARALNPGVYTAVAPHEEELAEPIVNGSMNDDDATQVSYEIKSTPAPVAPPPSPKPQKSQKPPKDAPDKPLPSKQVLAIKKLADKQGRIAEFVANQGDPVALRKMEQSLLSVSPAGTATTASPPSAETPATKQITDGEFIAFCNSYRTLLKLPAQNDVLQAMLMSEHKIKNLSKLTKKQREVVDEEVKLMQLFVECGGTLQLADEIVKDRAFQEKGWLYGGFYSDRETIVNTFVDRQNSE
jgi:hypothetical protein